MNSRHRRVGAALVGAMACAFAACSIGVDFDQYTKGNGVQVPDDGGTPPTTDSADHPDAVDAGFCPDPSAVTLCDDFDGHQDAGWTTATEHGGSVTKSDASASPPFSLESMRPEVGDAGYSAGGFLWRYVEPDLTTATIEADIKGCAPTRGFTNLLAVLDQFGSFVSFGFAFDGSGPKTYAFASTTTQSMPFLVGAALPTDRFTHVKWTIDFHPTAGRMAVEVDGVKLIDVASIATSNENVTQRAFQIGAYGAEGSACTANIDNIVFDAR